MTEGNPGIRIFQNTRLHDTRRRVLVVDDNPDAADSLHALLTVLGHHARVAYGGAEALATLRSESFDLAFIDICMPGMSGYQLVREMRAGGVAPRVIVAMTGLADIASRRKALEAGFEHYVVKPYEMEALEALLSDYA
jgi:CheY-like chemotaxis protein